MDELERQIVAWVDAETEGVDPVTPAEAMGPRAAAGQPRKEVRIVQRRRDAPLDRIVADMAVQQPDHIAVTGDLANIGQIGRDHV